MGGIAFIAGVIFVLMGMGHWQDTHNPGWLTAAIIVALFTLIGGVKSLFKRSK